MKRFILIAAVLSCATILMAGMDKVIAKISNVSTTAAPSIATTDRFTGYINRIDVGGFATNNAVLNLTVIATNSMTGLTTELPITSLLSSNSTQQLTNYVQRLAVYDEYVIVTATNAIGTNYQNVTVTVFYERP